MKNKHLLIVLLSAFIVQSYAQQFEAFTLGRDPLPGHDFNFYGAVNSVGGNASYSFVYSTDSTFATSDTSSVQNITNNALDVVWDRVNNLNPNSYYYYYITATANSSTANGEVMSFYSDTTNYWLENTGADIYGPTYAELHGKLNGFQQNASISFIYGATPNNLDSVVASDYSTVTDANTHYFRGFPSGFPAGNLFFYRIKTDNGSVIAYSDIKAISFNAPYYVQALASTNITTTSATLNGIIQNFDVPIKINSEVDGPGVNHYHSALDYHDVSASPINYSYNATGLQPNSHYMVRLKVESWKGNFYGDTAVTTLSTGIAAVGDAFTKIALWPNPAANQLNIELSSLPDNNTLVQLMDINGRLVKQITLPANQNKTTLNVADVESGIYMLRFTSGNATATHKVTIAK